MKEYKYPVVVGDEVTVCDVYGAYRTCATVISVDMDTMLVVSNSGVAGWIFSTKTLKTLSGTMMITGVKK